MEEPHARPKKRASTQVLKKKNLEWAKKASEPLSDCLHNQSFFSRDTTRPFFLALSFFVFVRHLRKRGGRSRAMLYFFFPHTHTQCIDAIRRQRRKPLKRSGKRGDNVSLFCGWLWKEIPFLEFAFLKGGPKEFVLASWEFFLGVDTQQNERSLEGEVS